MPIMRHALLFYIYTRYINVKCTHQLNKVAGIITPAFDIFRLRYLFRLFRGCHYVTRHFSELRLRFA